MSGQYRCHIPKIYSADGRQYMEVECVQEDRTCVHERAPSARIPTEAGRQVVDLEGCAVSRRTPLCSIEYPQYDKVEARHDRITKDQGGQAEKAFSSGQGETQGRAKEWVHKRNTSFTCVQALTLLQRLSSPSRSNLRFEWTPPFGYRYRQGCPVGYCTIMPCQTLHDTARVPLFVL